VSPARAEERSWTLRLVHWGPWLAVGVALVLVAAFVELSDELLEVNGTTAPRFAVDTSLLRFIALARRPWLNGVAMDLTALGSLVVVALFTIAFGALLLIKGDRAGATILVASSFAAALLTVVLKTLLERQRPAVVQRLVEVTGLSYPSGHSLASAAVYLTASLVVARHVARWSERVGIIAFTAVIVTLIGASRVYLGVHYPSDVGGGILVGTAWALVMAVVLRQLDRMSPHHPRNQQ
jgi:undecaprenyl-diphosphatase